VKGKECGRDRGGYSSKRMFVVGFTRVWGLIQACAGSGNDMKGFRGSGDSTSVRFAWHTRSKLGVIVLYLIHRFVNSSYSVRLGNELLFAENACRGGHSGN